MFNRPIQNQNNFNIPQSGSTPIYLYPDQNNKVYCRCDGGRQLMGSVNSQDGWFDTYHSQGTIARQGNINKCRNCGGIYIGK